MYSVKCTVYNVRCTMYGVQCTVYNVRCTMYGVQCTVYNVQCTMYSVQCTVYNVQCTMYSVQCTVYNVQCTMYKVLYFKTGLTLNFDGHFHLTCLQNLLRSNSVGHFDEQFRISHHAKRDIQATGIATFVLQLQVSTVLQQTKPLRFQRCRNIYKIPIIGI